MAENDLIVGGKRTRPMDRLAVMEGIEAAAQGFTVDGRRRGDACALGRSVRQTGTMVTERPLHLRGVGTRQDEAHRRIGRRPAQRRAKGPVEAAQMGADERMNLTIRPSPGQHRKDREQQDRRQRIPLRLIATRIGDPAEQRQQGARPRGNTW